MNLAIADADLMARALVGHYRHQDSTLLDVYSAMRLPDVRRAEELSDRMLRLIHGTRGIDLATDPLDLIRRGYLGTRPVGAAGQRGGEASASELSDFTTAAYREAMTQLPSSNGTEG